MKRIVVIIVSPFVLVCLIVWGIHLYGFWEQSFLFDKEGFVSKGYSQEEILFFSDIAFREADKLRK